MKRYRRNKEEPIKRTRRRREYNANPNYVYPQYFLYNNKIWRHKEWNAMAHSLDGLSISLHHLIISEAKRLELTPMSPLLKIYDYIFYQIEYMTKVADLPRGHEEYYSVAKDMMINTARIVEQLIIINV